MRTVKDLGTIASVWAHPDDETYLAGGLMAEAVGNGQRVVCVSATAGEHGTDDPATWTPGRLGALRRQEAADAMAVLGVEDHRWLDFEDGTLADLDPESAIERLVALIEDVRPDTIVTFGPEGITSHPDHVTVGRWTHEAWVRSGRKADLLQAAVSADLQETFADFLEGSGIYMTDERPVGLRPDQMTLHLVLDQAALDRKLAALAAMPSQTAPLLLALGSDDYRRFVQTESFVAFPRPDRAQVS